MIKTILKLLIVIAIGYGVFLVTTEDGAYWTKFKLYRLLITKQLEEIRSDYSNQSCRDFSAAEEANNYFEAFVTGYCRPKASEFASRKEFLCAVALNCSCPKGLDQSSSCSSNTLNWKQCADFDDTKTNYCNQTASTLEPSAGHVAADWNCFPKDTVLKIEGTPYRVTDKGGVIKGRRIDIWFDSCADALKATGIYKVTIPNL